MNIIRDLPKLKKYVPLSLETQLKYPNRYTEDELIKSAQMHKCFISNTEFQSRYKKWISGINYATGKKITINSSYYNRIKKQLIEFIGRDIWLNEMNTYPKFKDIDIEDYVKTTIMMQAEIDAINVERAAAVKAKEKELEPYNDQIQSIIKDIKQLKLFDEYIEFEGKKYGISKIHLGYHREDNCLGKLDEINYYEPCTCHLCEDWFGRGCNWDGGRERSYYKCKKCEKEFR